jgi:hypothetical protein
VDEPHRRSRFVAMSCAGTATMTPGGRSTTAAATCFPRCRRAFKLRAKLVERAFALMLDRGDMRRVWLRGREKVQKR